MRVEPIGKVGSSDRQQLSPWCTSIPLSLNNYSVENVEKGFFVPLD